MRWKGSPGADDVKVFLSYARADSHVVRTLADDLNSIGAQVFLDVETVEIGDSFQEVIRKTILISDIVVVLMSPAYFESQWAKVELSVALEANKRLLPVLLSGEPQGALSYLQYLDASQLSEDELAAQVSLLVRGAI